MYDYQLKIGDIILTNDQIVSPKLSKNVSGNGMTVGDVVVGAFTVSIPDRTENSSSIYDFPPQAEVEFSANGIKIGTYFIARRKKVKNFAESPSLLQLTCYDRLAFSNKEFTLGAETGQAESTFEEALAFILEELGCGLDGSFLGSSYSFSLDKTRTIREVLSMIAGGSGGSFFMTLSDKLAFVTPYIVSKMRELDISADDMSPPFLGNPWFLKKVTVTGDNGEFSSGTGELRETLRFQNDAASQDMADIIMTNCNNIAYLPFEISNAKVPIFTNLYDIVHAWEYQINGITSKTYMTKLDLEYFPDCAYASLGAANIDDIRYEFDLDTNARKVEKDHKIGTVRLGNKYGMKSTAKKTTATATPNSREFSQKLSPLKSTYSLQEARIDNAEITFRDLTDMEKPIDCGKIYIDADGSANMDCKGLKTAAQDIRGAINELFSSEPKGGDEWLPPSDWLKNEYPGDGKVAVIAGIWADNDYNRLSFDMDPGVGISTVDWGDGTVETSEYSNLSHYYEKGVGHLIGGGNTQVRAVFTPRSGSKLRINSQPKCAVLINVGAGVILGNSVFSGTGYQTLCEVILPKGMELLPYYAFGDCMCLKKITIPEGMTDLGIEAFNNCYGLRTVHFPKSLAVIKQTDFEDCLGLWKISIFRGTVIEDGAFSPTSAVMQIEVRDD